MRGRHVICDLYSDPCGVDVFAKMLPPEITWMIWRSAKVDQFMEKVSEFKRKFKPPVETDRVNDYFSIQASRADGQIVDGHTLKLNKTVIVHYAGYHMGMEYNQALSWLFNGKVIYSEQWNDTYEIVKNGGETHVRIL